MAAHRILTGLLILSLWPGFADAQHMFLDTNGDGACSAADALSANGPTTVDIWLRTDANRDGSSPIASSTSSIPLSIFSYEFILHATGGAVEWGQYTNLQPAMASKFGEYRSNTDFYVGFGDGPALPPGKYRLGTLTLRATSGAPRLQFIPRSPIWYGAKTSFGSMNPGKEGWNTLIFTGNHDDLGKSDTWGDWADADGVAATTTTTTIALASAMKGDTPSRFEVSVAPNPLNPEATITISTTRAGFIRVRLFDVTGRLVRVLLDETSAPPARYLLRLSTAASRDQYLASGVYFYSVDAAEGHLEGRVAVLK